MTRPRSRVATVAIAVAGSLVLLAGCAADSDGDADAAGSPDASGASSDATAPVPDDIIEFWGFVPGLEDLVDQWNESGQGTEVAFKRMTGDDSAKVGPAVDAGTGPDIVQLSPLDLPDYVIRERIVDITEYAAEYEDQFTPSSWANFVLNESVYGIPQDIGPRALMIRTDIFEQYGLTVPTTWDEYIETARTLKAANPEVFIGNYDPTAIGAWKADVIQEGGSWYDTEGDSWVVDINGEASQTVATRWQTLIDEDLVATDVNYQPEFWANVAAGKYASLFAPAWYPVIVETNVPDSIGNWELVPMPSTSGGPEVGDDGGSGDVVLTGAQDPEGAVEFLIWLNANAETAGPLIEVGGLYPASNVGLEAPELTGPSEMFAGQEINEVFKTAAESVPPVWVNGPTWGTDQLNLADEFVTAFDGTQTFADALDTVQEKSLAAFEERGLTVTEAS